MDETQSPQLSLTICLTGSVQLRPSRQVLKSAFSIGWSVVMVTRSISRPRQPVSSSSNQLAIAAV